MVTVFDIGKDRSIFYKRLQRLGHTDIIDAPSFIRKPDGRKALAPPGVLVGFRMKLPESIDPSAAVKFIHPCAFIWKETGCVFVAGRIMDVNFFVGNVVVATKDNVLLFCS